LTPSAFLPLLIFAAMAELDIAVPEGGAVQVYLETETGTFAAPVTYTTTPYSRVRWSWQTLTETAGRTSSPSVRSPEGSVRAG